MKSPVNGRASTVRFQGRSGARFAKGDELTAEAQRAQRKLTDVQLEATKKGCDMSLDVSLYFECDTGTDETLRAEVFDGNITHNLGKMAREAGVYDACWCPIENGLTHAGHLIEPLTKGIEQLMSKPNHFREFNPDNNWGSYEGLLEFLRAYLEACQKYPKAKISCCK